MAERMAMDGIRAFDRQSDGTWLKTPEMQKVEAIIRNAGGKDFNIEAAPSVLADINGNGMWGTGGGVHYTDGSGTYVDPVRGNVSTGAHEAAHASFPTELVNPEVSANAYEKLQGMGEAPLGNQARAVYETISKPIMLEEANAQGVAAGAMHKAGYDFNTNGWTSVPTQVTGLNQDIPAELAYPAEYRYGGYFDRGFKAYERVNDINPEGRQYTPDERQAIEMTRGSFVPAMQRQFKEGYNLIK